MTSMRCEFTKQRGAMEQRELTRQLRCMGLCRGGQQPR